MAERCSAESIDVFPATPIVPLRFTKGRATRAEKTKTAEELSVTIEKRGALIAKAKALAAFFDPECLAEDECEDRRDVIRKMLADKFLHKGPHATYDGIPTGK